MNFSLPKPSPARRKTAIGLDIGSSAVRAVALAHDGRARKVVAAGQVGLPTGAVVEGEIRDRATVVSALKKLWSDGGFDGKTVVVGVSGPRVIVREALVTAMSAEDFRSAMTFEVQDLIPIPVADALLDFEILGPGPAGPDERERMRILLAAAEKDVVWSTMAALEEAGLEAEAVDPLPLAMARALGGGMQQDPLAAVSVGASLTTVTLTLPGGGIFSRTLAVGGRRTTEGLGNRLGVAVAEAEAVKRYAGGQTSSAARAAALVSSEAAAIVTQIRESLEFFQGQAKIDQLGEICLTGGAALTSGLPEMLQEAIGAPVRLGDPFAGLAVDAGVDPSLIERLTPVAAGAAGLAEWAGLSAPARLSLLPTEIVLGRRQKRFTQAVVAGVAVLAVALAGTWYQRDRQVTATHAALAAAQTDAARYASSASELRRVDSYIAAVAARQQQMTSAGLAIDYPALISQIASAMPADTTLNSLSLSGPAGASTSTSSAAAATGYGSVTMSVSAQGGEDTVAVWLRAMTKVTSLENVFVGSSSTSNGTTTFSCTANISKTAPFVHYAWEAHS